MDIETIINDYEFLFEPDTEATKKSAMTLQLLMNYLNAVVGLQDTNGKPVADVKAIADQIRESLGLPDSYDLSEENLVTRPTGQG